MSKIKDEMIEAQEKGVEDYDAPKSPSEKILNFISHDWKKELRNPYGDNYPLGYVPEELLNRSTKNNNCIEYKHSLNGKGYGVVRFRGKNFLEKFKVNQSTISRIINNITWKHLC